MKIAKGIQERGIEVGNHYDKYGSSNPIAKFLMRGFTDNLDQLVSQTNANNIHEIGCGEGHWSLRWISQGKQVRACDFSETVIAIAKQNATEQNLNPNVFSAKSIYDLEEIDKAELVVCCEVLEHLEFPREALRSLVAIASPWLILSVPREPIWSVMNLARGKYIAELGNTPGHIQRWSSEAFINMVREEIEVVEVRQPLPWTMLLCKT